MNTSSLSSIDTPIFVNGLQCQRASIRIYSDIVRIERIFDVHDWKFECAKCGTVSYKYVSNKNRNCGVAPDDYLEPVVRQNTTTAWCADCEEHHETTEEEYFCPTCAAQVQPAILQTAVDASFAMFRHGLIHAELKATLFPLDFPHNPPKFDVCDQVSLTGGIHGAGYITSIQYNTSAGEMEIDLTIENNGEWKHAKVADENAEVSRGM